MKSMNKSLIRSLALAVVCLVGFSAVAQAAEDLGAVKARLEQRLPKIDELKAKGVVGENNRGLMELRGGDADAGDVVAAENRDRGIVYAEIAKQTRTTVEQVGRARARQIAGASAPGVWLQKDDGSWYRK